MVTNVAWLLLSYRVPREPSAPRIAVWRRLKRLGVAQLGDGLVALPADARTKEHLEWIAELVDEAGGSSSLWRAEVTGRRDEERIIADLVAARAAEYEAVIARAHEAIEPEAARVLRSLRQELRQIERRDHFPPENRELARAAVRELAERVSARATEAVVS
ncbi:Chromate resistance protein ChrB [Agromyces salentinus]|uniref:ChrB N-terminal domain-containing protein n=1 Tax=Agromyces salentinus TaxID=269421 RepID=A0ABN2MIE5_9MICO|nr:Chromate resistance protein ChrB [Agromyces salentinus]